MKQERAQRRVTSCNDVVVVPRMRDPMTAILLPLLLLSCIHCAASWVPPTPLRTIDVSTSRRRRTPSVAVTSKFLPTFHNPFQGYQDQQLLFSSPGSGDDGDSLVASVDPRDQWYSSSSTSAAVGAQSALIPLALVGASLLHLDVSTPWDTTSVLYGVVCTIPLILMYVVLDRLEKQSVALQEVSAAVNRAVYTLLGGTFKPLLALVTAVTLGIVAGWGEELLFRGVLQNFLVQQSSSAVVGVLGSSLLFGLVHAVTPLYVILTLIASIYFGSIYIFFDHNLTIPIVCHAVYDVGALLYAHYTVSQLSMEELQKLLKIGDDGSATKP